MTKRKSTALVTAAILAQAWVAAGCQGPTGASPPPASPPVAVTREGDVVIERLVAGAGPSAVGPGSLLTMRYRGTLADGTVFADAEDPPAGPWPLRGLVEGLRIGLLGMQVGEQRRIVVPPALGYGDHAVLDENNATLIPGGATLVFTVELLELQTAADRAGQTPSAGEGETPPDGPAAENAERAR